MEADWTVELGHGDPVIEVPWDACGGCRFVDLRQAPQLIDEIAEARERPVLRSALLALNAPGSLWCTAKSGIWNSSADESGGSFDPYEMDADFDQTAFGAGCYVDLWPRDAAVFASFERQQQWMRGVIEQLRSKPAKAVRVELVLRAAEIEAVPGFAVTWFVEACGATEQQAQLRWTGAVGLALETMMGTRFDAI